jgi:alpha-L-fucosidase
MPSSSPYQISRRQLLAAAGAATTFGLLRFAPTADATVGPSSYTPDWSSVDQHPPAPAWFQDAKFGIYYHWGVYSVPAYGNEWYPRRMYISGDDCNSHHIATYGDPSVWPYHFFINGANDRSGRFVQFAPKLASAGGNWDPDAWATLFKNAGARFAGPVAEHHDGYSMWNSTSNPWNAVRTGPKLDLVAQHGRAIRGQGLKFMCSLHHAYHFNGYYDHVPYQSDPNLRILYAQQGTAAENLLWYNKLIEVIDGYQPDLIYQDFDLSLVQESYRLQFLAYYYNKAVAWNKDVVATYKDGLDNKGEVYDYERGGPGGLLTPYWETDDAISSSSWCYTVGLGYYTTQALLHALIDRVAKGGTMLLNISPMADGTIPSQQQTILLGLGDWLGRFGEALYSTRSWTSFGEGPTQMGGGSFTGPRAGTPQDIRFTRSQDNSILYATALGWQGGTMTITSLGSGNFNIAGLVSAQLLGNTAGTYINLPKPTQDGGGLHFSMPSSNPPYSALAYTVKLTFSGQIGGPPGNGHNTITVTNPGSQSGTVGTAITAVQVQASDSASGQTLTYSATGLPPGLSISSAGLISGTPTAAGNYNVTVTAQDSTGASGSASFTWAVSGGSTGGTVSVAYQRTSEWPGGFTANVTITNNGTSAINGWTVAWSFPGDQKVTNGWNATISQSGAAVTAATMSYNSSIAPGGNVQFGFQGTFTSNDSSPTSFTVNGVPAG